MNRRQFLKLSAGLGGAALLSALGAGCMLKTGKNTIQLPPLPYGKRALEPYLSERTLSLHHDVHHKAYVDKANMLLSQSQYKSMSLDEIMAETADNVQTKALFNNTAQAFNHSFYWNSMTPGGGGDPPESVLVPIRASFGEYGRFVDAFTRAALSQFGSGWVWLVEEGGCLSILSTSNAGTPAALGMKPVIALDVWEHAYYLDYQNRRGDYVHNFLTYLINWEFAGANLRTV